MKFRQETSPKSPPTTHHHPSPHVSYTCPPSYADEQTAAPMRAVVGFHCYYMAIITAAFRSYFSLSMYYCCFQICNSIFIPQTPPSLCCPSKLLSLSPVSSRHVARASLQRARTAARSPILAAASAATPFSAVTYVSSRPRLRLNSTAEPQSHIRCFPKSMLFSRDLQVTNVEQLNHDAKHITLQLRGDRGESSVVPL